MIYDLEKKIVLVCSGDTDLGMACISAFLKEKATVYTSTKSKKSFKELANKYLKDSFSKKKLTVINADIATESGRKKCLSKCSDPDILINHYPGPSAKHFLELKISDWMEALNNCLILNLEMTKKVISGMNKRKFGRIINISSISVLHPIQNLELSTVARSGLEGYIKSVARKEIFKYVTINNLLPGYFMTTALENHLNSFHKKDRKKKIDEILVNIPVKRFGDPKEFAEICCFLASKKGGYIHGQTIQVSGGQYI